MLKANYQVIITAKQHARLIKAAIAPDLANMQGDRATVRMLERTAGITFEIHATDSTALRAAMNSVLKCMQTVENATKIK